MDDKRDTSQKRSSKLKSLISRGDCSPLCCVLVPGNSSETSIILIDLI
eukprot:gene8214-5739_t